MSSGLRHSAVTSVSSGLRQSAVNSMSSGLRHGAVTIVLQKYVAFIFLNLELQ
jgi:hypothetical protein